MLLSVHPVDITILQILLQILLQLLLLPHFFLVQAFLYLVFQYYFPAIPSLLAEEVSKWLKELYRSCCRWWISTCHFNTSTKTTSAIPLSHPIPNDWKPQLIAVFGWEPFSSAISNNVVNYLSCGSNHSNLRTAILSAQSRGRLD